MVFPKHFSAARYSYQPNGGFPCALRQRPNPCASARANPCTQDRLAKRAWKALKWEENEPGFEQEKERDQQFYGS